MKRQVWLRANVRALSCGLIVPVLFAALGLSLAVGLPSASSYAVFRWLGWGCFCLASLLTALLIYAMRIPRLAYQNGQLLVYLRSVRPVCVPIEVVECFFLGNAPSLMRDASGNESRTATVVVRIAESATAWHNVEVNALLGRWCDGYITIRGTWCEPLRGDLLNRLNAYLVEAHRESRKPELHTA